MIDPRVAIHHFASLGSTNDEALRRAAEGAPDRTLIIAERQTGGRGRRGRPWASVAGNLHLSLVVDGSARAAPPGLLALAAGIAAAEACSGYGIAVQLKWPNDLVVEGAKLGGILIEAAGEGRYIVGIGINLAHAPEVEGRLSIALAALAVGKDCSVETFVQAFVPLLMQWADRWQAGDAAAIRAAWLARAHGLGQTITLMNGQTNFVGSFAGLAADGALLLESGGAVRPFHAGEVSLSAGPRG